jgi:ribonuclease Z
MEEAPGLMRTSVLHCLGVGEGRPSPAHDHAAFLYRLGRVALLIDCGEPVSRNLRRAGLGCNLLDRVFISHLHSDHVGGLFMLIQGFMIEGRTKDLTVHLPTEGIAPVFQMLQAAYLFEEYFAFHLQFAALRHGVPVVTEGVRVTPFPSSHLDPVRAQFQRKYPRPFEAFCFLIEFDGMRLVHSADLGAPEDLAPLLDEPVDLLVCEMAHFTPFALFKFLCGHSIKRLVLTHLDQRLCHRLPELERLARKTLKGVPVTIAVDGQEISL